MDRKFPEPDWKVFRDLKHVALNRFCERVLGEIVAIAGNSRKSHHERYLALYKRLHNRDKELANAFDGMARSRAFDQLVLIRHQKLLTDDEFARFSAETRERVDGYLAIMTGGR